jgi:hypothetical protein
MRQWAKVCKKSGLHLLDGVLSHEITDELGEERKVVFAPLREVHYQNTPLYKPRWLKILTPIALVGVFVVPLAVLVGGFALMFSVLERDTHVAWGILMIGGIFVTTFFAGALMYWLYKRLRNHVFATVHFGASRRAKVFLDPGQHAKLARLLNVVADQCARERSPRRVAVVYRTPRASEPPNLVLPFILSIGAIAYFWKPEVALTALIVLPMKYGLLYPPAFWTMSKELKELYFKAAQNRTSGTRETLVAYETTSALERRHLAGIALVLALREYAFDRVVHAFEELERQGGKAWMYNVRCTRENLVALAEAAGDVTSQELTPEPAESVV